MSRAAPLAFGLVIVACSLHTSGMGDVPIADGTGPSAVDASVRAGDDGPEAAPASDAIAASDAGPSPAPDDASVIDDTGAILDAVVIDPDAPFDAATSDPCDLDRDGHAAKTAACGGDDCCDYDGRVFTGAVGYYGAPSACGSFDFNCDGKETVRYGTEQCKLGFLSCSGDGFTKNTACGATADYVTCGFAVLACSHNVSSRAQLCR